MSTQHPITRSWQTLAVLLCCAACPVLAQQQATTIAGVWRGELTTPVGAPLEMVFWIEADGDGWSGLCDTPAQGVFGLPMTVTDNDGALSMAVTATGGEYRASLSEDGNKLEGQWLQRGAELDLTCSRQPSPPAIPEALRDAVAGTWEGPLDVGAIEMRLVLVVETGANGRIEGHMASPDQSDKTMPITRTDLLDEGRLRLCIGTAFAQFRVAAGDDPNTLEGQFQQGQRAFDISLKRTDAPTKVNRPQEPKPPFPYEAREVSYRNEPGGITLAGTLTLPEGEGPFPAALLITGSGAQDRDETIFQHKPFLVLADHLSRRGIAVLRVDDRGVGGSTHGDNPEEATTADFAGDVLAGVAFLKAQTEIDPKRIGLIGHSEGGIIAPMVAVESTDVAFLVLLAGTGIPGADIVVMQTELLGADEDNEEEAAQNLALQKRLVALARDASLSNPELGAAVREILVELPEYSDEENGEAAIQTVIQQLTTPWVRWFFHHDPAPVLENVRCPVLAINGTRDLQVPSKVNLDAIGQALANGGNGDYEVRALPDLNHLFQHCETGHPSEYGKIEETFSPEALECVSNWITKRFVDRR